MITFNEIEAIGYVAKTHGIKGEINLRLDTDFNPEDFRFLVFEIDTIFVPFKIKQARGNANDSRIVLLDGVDDVEEAKMFVGKTAYVLKSELINNPLYENVEKEGGIYLSDLVGYTLEDENGRLIGEITGFNDDTQNFLLEVKLHDGERCFIPYVDEWVLELDAEKKILMMNLPEGLIN